MKKNTPAGHEVPQTAVSSQTVWGLAKPAKSVFYGAFGFQWESRCFLFVFLLAPQCQPCVPLEIKTWMVYRTCEHKVFFVNFRRLGRVGGNI